MLDGHNAFVCLERVHFPEFIDRKPDTFFFFFSAAGRSRFYPIQRVCLYSDAIDVLGRTCCCYGGLSGSSVSAPLRNLSNSRERERNDSGEKMRKNHSYYIRLGSSVYIRDDHLRTFAGEASCCWGFSWVVGWGRVGLDLRLGGWGL